MNLPDWLVLWTWRALLGEIYPGIRAIALRYDEDRKLLLRYYLDREPTGEDIDSVGRLSTNIFANTSSGELITSIEEEVVQSKVRMADLDALDGLVYARRE